MPREQIRVTPAVLTWARERSGFSIAELHPQFKNIDRWEAGESSPTYPQLERLADKLKTPVAVFFFPKPPDLPPIRESFRTLSGAAFKRIPPRILYLLRKAKAMQLNLAELNDGGNPAEKLIVRDFHFDRNVSTKAVVRRVRKYLGVSMDAQRSWKDDDTALKNWRRALENAGVFVFKDAFRAEGYSGFCLYDKDFPVLYVNNSESKARQIFTLFHELAHLLFRTSGIDALDNRYRAEFTHSLSVSARGIETACNRFAGQFLVPEDELQAVLGRKEPTEETAGDLANRFHVSRSLISLRFLKRGLIQEDTYAAFVEKWGRTTRKDRPKGQSGGDYYNSQISYLGSRYIDLALRRYNENRIDDAQLADYLNIAPKNLSKLAERFAASGV